MDEFVVKATAVYEFINCNILKYNIHFSYYMGNIDLVLVSVKYNAK